jgi:hypothetical protein
MGWNTNYVDSESAYVKSFGEMKSGVAYDGYDSNFQKRLENPIAKAQYLNLQKAAISGRAAGTAGVVGIPIYLDPQIVDITARETPLSAMIRRVSNRGKSADYDRLVARARANWKAEDASMVEAEDTYETKNKAIKYLYAVGRVTGPLFAASKERMSEAGYGDFLNLEVQNKARSLKEDEENSLINGSTSTNANEPNGLIAELTANANKTNWASAGDFKITDFDEAIRICRTAGDSATLGGAEPNLVVTDYATENKIKGLFYDAYQIQAPTTTFGFGKTAAVVNGIPVMGSRFMTAASGSRNLMLLNTNYIETRVLQDMTYEELAKTNDSDKFMLKEYLTWVVKAPEFMNLWYNVN